MKTLAWIVGVWAVISGLVVLSDLIQGIDDTFVNLAAIVFAGLVVKLSHHVIKMEK